MEGASLNASILLSLEFLQDEFVTRKLKTDRSISDLYTSLCILEHQAWVPVSVLRRLWQLDEDEAMAVVHLFSDMSLATLRRGSESSREVGIVLHDLQLDFCQHQTEKKNKTSLWHAQLLSGYIAASNEPRAEESKCNYDRCSREFRAETMVVVGCFRRGLYSRKSLATFELWWSWYRAGGAVAGWTMDASAGENRRYIGAEN